VCEIGNNAWLLINTSANIFIRGMRWHNWLRHCTTSRKVAGLIPDGVIGIFHRHMDLGSTQPLRKMSTEECSLGRKDGRCVGLTTLPPSCTDCFEIGECQPPGISDCPDLYRDCFTFTYAHSEIRFMTRIKHLHFQYRDAILRELFRTKKYKLNTLV
jgi:hypothetical protein